MLSSITPLGERSKGNRFPVSATLHIVGSGLGGALLGAMAAGAGGLARAVGSGWDERTATMAVALVAVAAGLVDLVWTPRHRLPSWRRQVNEQWLDEYRPWVYAGGFGLQLGLGVVTIITSATTYAAVGAAVLQPTPARAVVVGSTFGLARGLTVLAAARVDRPERLVTLHRHIASAAAPAARGIAVAAVALGGLALGGLALGVSA